MNIYRGLGASDGVAIGKVLIINSAFMNYPRFQIETREEVEFEIKRVLDAKKATEDHLNQVMAQSENIIPEEIRAVFSSYKMFIGDKRFFPAIIDKIEQLKINAEWALIHVLADLDRMFEQIPDPYIRSRFDDIRQLGEKVMYNLKQKQFLDLRQLKHPVIIVCHDISPADSFHLNPKYILGIITELGGETSHSSILARAMNIPAVVGVQDISTRLLDDTQIILDGLTGEIFENPTEKIVKEKLNKQERYNLYQSELQELLDEDCELADGKRIELAANLDYMEELEVISTMKVSSLGLIRTEFLFLLDEGLPGEEEQLKVFNDIIKRSNGIPITIRTWDIGMDKGSSFFPELIDEVNPALGLRGIRICLNHQEFFRVQIRAILRASKNGKIRLMIPMVTRADEVVRTNAIIQEELESLNIPRENIEIGCMIETPGATFIVDELLDLIDFVSIGTNDLIQYSLAVDRLNEHVSNLYTPFHPAILKMLEVIITIANRRNKYVSICGELAADPIMQLFLIGVGKITFSMSPNQILRTKRFLKKVDTTLCKKVAFQFASKHSLEESRSYVEQLRKTYIENIEFFERYEMET
ncbi:MAG: phosphoenolpyruvate--protein phosphotransferase [Deltaproteobacteria bacterium]|nr:phosphoenolpyruvate--protein phosphotransferase [Deltaproteobacteria bacterium]